MREPGHWIHHPLYKLSSQFIIYSYQIHKSLLDILPLFPTMAAATLLQGGTVLTHDDDDNVIAKKVDILIEGGIITKIEAGIVPPSSAKIVDCKNKIVSPGFIDTHHHVWQTLLKGRVANELLLGYFVPGMTHAFEAIQK